MRQELDSLKWNVWHGNVFRTLEHCDGLALDLECMQAADEPEPKPAAIRKLWKAIREFRHYLEANRSFIPNYRDRYRHGEPISSAPAEATINQVVSKRMVKKQQMRWSDKGAHLLLQPRVKVLNGESRPMFHQWYPGMKRHDPTLPLAV